MVDRGVVVRGSQEDFGCSIPSNSTRRIREKKEARKRKIKEDREKKRKKERRKESKKKEGRNGIKKEGIEKGWK